MTIHVNSPWFSKICFRLNGNSIENRLGAEYKCAERDAQEIIDTLSGICLLYTSQEADAADQDGDDDAYSDAIAVVQTACNEIAQYAADRDGYA